MDRFCYLCFVFVIFSCLFIYCSLRSLLGKGWPLGSLVCYVLLCFCHFLMWCPGSGVLLDCIDSGSISLLTMSYPNEILNLIVNTKYQGESPVFFYKLVMRASHECSAFDSID